jgi:acetyl-CoA carboxylase carboxyltransferase component
MTTPEPDPTALDSGITVASPFQGVVVEVAVKPGDRISAGAALAVLELMKMHHTVPSPVTGTVLGVSVRPGDSVREGQSVAVVVAAADAGSGEQAAEAVDLEAVRPDLAEVLARHEAILDQSRPEAVARRHDAGRRTARENLADLADPGSFREYGALVVAAQKQRRSLEELRAKTPADGLVAGIGTVNADLFGPERSRCVVMSYDYTVLAGTQGQYNHLKKDRLFELAAELRCPVVLFAEGGGGRPGDTDGLWVSALDVPAFRLFAELSGSVPLVGITAGYTFAGNAALLGCCDVVIATEGSNIGMGGPAMIEGGGLGRFHPSEVGPMSAQVPGGVVDLLVADEAEAVAVAKRYLGYFQGDLRPGPVADPRILRHLVPEDRLRVYEVRPIIEALCDEGSVLELRRGFGPGMVTALGRVEGRPLGILANDPSHLGGAIDADAADKAARFLQLCDAHGLPVLTLCDTPGFMVGPEAEETALVRHVSRMFVTGANLTVPMGTIVLRKGYGLGAQAMAGGAFQSGVFIVSWPTGEFGPMGLEGAVELGYRAELAAIEDEDERRRAFDAKVAEMYEVGRATSVAQAFEIDAVIDPSESRTWIRQLLDGGRRSGGRSFVDTW